jgi:hypothetical protein
VSHARRRLSSFLPLLAPGDRGGVAGPALVPAVRARGGAGLAAAAALLGALLAGCAAPSLSVEASPPQARVFLDGDYVGAGAVRVPLAYYGVVDCAAVEPVPRSPAQPPAAHARAEVRVDEPVTPWLFPLDLAGEALVRLWHQPEGAVALRVEPRARVEPGVVPPNDALRARAAALRTAR